MCDCVQTKQIQTWLKYIESESSQQNFFFIVYYTLKLVVFIEKIKSECSKLTKQMIFFKAFGCVEMLKNFHRNFLVKNTSHGKKIFLAFISSLCLSYYIQKILLLLLLLFLLMNRATLLRRLRLLVCESSYIVVLRRHYANKTSFMVKIFNSWDKFLFA